jgi:integrase
MGGTWNTMCRREELVSLLIEEVEPAEDGPGTVVIRRSKTDVMGGLRQGYCNGLEGLPERSERRLGVTPLSRRRRARARRPNSPANGRILTAYLSPLTMRLVGEWINLSRRKSGTLFARVLGKNRVSEHLTPQTVMAVLRKVGKWIGLESEDWKGISGHSARVGAAQDLLALNMDLPSVMQAGRWRDTRMPMRYGEKVLAGRGAMARAAKSQGRA